MTDDAGKVFWRAIYLAPLEVFDDPEQFLFVMAHEMIHAVGFNLGSVREGVSSTNWTFGTTSCDSEERVADLGANLLMQIFDVDFDSYDFRELVGVENDEETLEARARVSYLVSQLSDCLETINADKLAISSVGLAIY